MSEHQPLVINLKQLQARQAVVAAAQVFLKEYIASIDTSRR
jgi:hypothetical protein